MHFFYLSLLFFTFLLSNSSDVDSLSDIKERLKHQQTAFLYETATLSMTITNEKGQQRVRDMKLWQFAKDSILKTVLIFEKPTQVKGTGLLTLREGKSQTQKLYLPAVKRVQTIGSSQKGDSFMSSDFTYEDLGQFDSDAAEWKLRSESASEYLITALNTGSESRYDSLIVTISKRFDQPERIEYFRKGFKEKELNFEAFEEIKSGIFRAKKLTMKTIQSGSFTTIEWKSRSFEPIPDSYFTERLLLRGN